MSDTSLKPLAAAIRGVLRPLVRILLRNGAPFGVFAEYARQIYVEVAAKEFALPNRKNSISRISVLTGLTRKEVSRILKQPDQDTRGVERYNRCARVVTAWTRDKRYRGDGGRPRSLPFEGRGATFSDLVKRYGGDVPPRAVLDELLRVEAVKPAREGHLRLLTRSYVPSTGEEEGLSVLESDAADLISAIDHNLTHPPEEAFIQRRVACDNLAEESLPELRARAAQRGQSLLEDFDRVMARNGRGAGPDAASRGRYRAVLGIYFYEHPCDED